MTRAYFASKRCKKRMLSMVIPARVWRAFRFRKATEGQSSRSCRSLLAVLRADAETARKAMELLVQDLG